MLAVSGSPEGDFSPHPAAHKHPKTRQTLIGFLTCCIVLPCGRASQPVKKMPHQVQRLNLTLLDQTVLDVHDVTLAEWPFLAVSALLCQSEQHEDVSHSNLPLSTSLRRNPSPAPSERVHRATVHYP